MAYPEISGYQIERELGAGAFATAYLARNVKLERKEVLKVLHAHLASDETFTRRFLREARMVAKLSDPHIVTIYNVGVESGVHFLAMEYCASGDLQERIAKNISPEQALTITKDIAQALVTATKAGLIHRDVKPANILFRSDGSTALADFGIAQATDTKSGLTQTKTIMGTPHYMSPEQFTEEKLDGRSDLYSLGIVFYEMLTHRVPFEAGSYAEISHAHMKEAVPPLNTKLVRFQPLVDALLAKKPSERISTGTALARLIDNTLTNELDPDKTLAIYGSRPRADASAQSVDTAHVSGSPKIGLWISALLLIVAGTAGFLARDQITPLFENLLPAAVPESTSFRITGSPEAISISFLDIDQPYDPGMLLPLGRYRIEASAQGFKSTQLWLEHTGTTLTHQIALEIDPQPFAIVVDQEDAQIELLDTTENYSPGVQLPPGEYRARISAEGYEERLVTVAHGRWPTSFAVNLELSAGPFTVLARPVNSAIRLIGYPEEYTPGKILPPGDYRVEISAENYVTKTEQITHGSAPTVFRTQLNPVTYPLSVATIPAWADIWLPEEELTYRQNMELAGGDYRVEVTAKGYVSQTVLLSHGPAGTNHLIKLALTKPTPQQPSPSQLSLVPADNNRPSAVDNVSASSLVVPTANLIVSTVELLDAVELGNVRFRKIGQFTQTQVDLVNSSDLPVDLEYRISWQDDQGFDTGGLNSWQFVSVAAQGSESLTSLGKVPEAKNITLTVRLPELVFEER
ncbi:MAG: DUF1425 domain-containing protein [Gammaproteobacteria bacterium]|nr:DUF1425 domain-containing protein [Gammaproteobacteria bacterium]